MKINRFLLFPTSVAACLTLFSPAAQAAAITWDAGGINNNWSTFNNWSDDADPTGDDVTFNATGALASGTTNTVGSSVSIGSLSYNFESATTQHTTAIAAGQTLSVVGNFSVLSGTAPAAPTNVSITGATGTLDILGTNILFGNPTATSANSTTSVDMSGLGTLKATATIFRVGGGGAAGATTGNAVTLTLASNSTITADTVGVSDFSNFSTVQKMLLGSGTNTINTDSLRVGSSSGRGSGEISFNTGTGTLLLRGLAGGTSAVTSMTMVNSTQNTSNNLTSVVNLAGHSVDAKITTLNMAVRTGTANSASGTVADATLTFDQGTLEVGTANMGRNGNASLIGKIAATINIGGGLASFDTINMADNSSGNTTKTTTATLNLTGGSTTVTGNIVKLGGTNAIANVVLDGGTLDMTNGAIGDATNAVNLTLASGTLKNVAEINGGGLITKTSTGNLTLSGTNTFTGGMNMFGGEVKITGSGSFGTGAKSLNIQNAAYVHLDGTGGDITLSSGITMTTAGLSFLNTAGNNTINGAISIIAGNSTTTVTSDGGSLNLAGGISAGVTSARSLELSGTSVGANIVGGAISDGDAPTVSLVKSGTGTWSLTNSNTYSGITTVSQGTLLVNGDNSAATGAVTVQSGATLGGSGPVGGATTIQSAGHLAVGNSPGTQTFSSSLTLDLGAVVDWDLAGNTTTGRGTNYDGINVTGILGIDSAAIFRVIQNTGLNFNDVFWDSDQTWTDIFNAGTLTSNWSNGAVSVYDTNDALQDVSTYGSFSITGGTLAWTAVPEPSSALTALLGAGLLLRRRREA